MIKNLLIRLPWENIYIVSTTLFLIIGIFLIYDNSIRKNVLKQKGSLRRTAHEIAGGIRDKNINKKYEAIRNLITLLLLLISCVTVFSNVKKGVMLLLVSLAIYFFSQPEDKILGRKSPYRKGKELIKKTREEALKQELFTITVQLKNLIISGDGKSLSVNYVLSRLIPYTNLSKPYFTQLLMLNMKGMGTEAQSIFSDNFGFKAASDFAYILLKLDELPASEFLIQIDAVLTELKEERNTYFAKKQVMTENLLFTLASIEIVALLINYMVLVLVNTIGMMQF